MNILVYFLFLIWFFTLGAAAILYFLFFIDTLYGHDLPTSRRAIREIIKIVRSFKPDAKNFYDLGCGRGTLALAVKSEFPELNVFALDKSGLRLLFARLKNFVLGRGVIFQNKNIFDADLRSADILYTYLWYDWMPPLEEKLRKELKTGAIVITNTSHFSKWQPIATYITYPKKPDFEKLFVYRVE
ncbi:hypothetical protein HYV91_02800 [Candidatus Wolfebacteria bacterium]|nr:hypothetical protein [Candidatus Wolfebacteria bacterium]